MSPSQNTNSCFNKRVTISLNIFIYFSEEHIHTQNRKFGTMNNTMKKKRMGKQVQNTYTSSSPYSSNNNEIQKSSKIIRVDMLKNR